MTWFSEHFDGSVFSDLDVRRLQIAMDDAAVMGGFERVRDLRDVELIAGKFTYLKMSRISFRTLSLSGFSQSFSNHFSQFFAQGRP